MVLAFALVLTACGGTAESVSTTLTSATSQGETTSTDLVATTIASVTSEGTAHGGQLRLEHEMGFVLEYPPGWTQAGVTIASQFAAEAECVAVKIVDFEPPVDSGQGQAGFVLQSVVQVCGQPTDGVSLETYMRSLYGSSVGEFERTEVGGLEAYQLDEGLDTLVFVQTDTYRFQIYASVAADPGLEAERIGQVREVIETLTFL